MIEVYAIKIDVPIEDKLFNQLLSCVLDEKHERINKYHFIEDT